VARALVAEPTGEVAFRSPDELREVLESMLESVERDQRRGPMLRAAGIRTRLEFTDMDLALNVASSDDPDRSLEWSFDRRAPWTPKLVLRMDSDVANRWLQGRESIAVALARGQVQCRGESRSALFFLPTVKLLGDPYRRLLAGKYAHLRVP
jgi:hypothetical protein